MERSVIDDAQVSELVESEATIVVSIQQILKGDQRQQFREIVQQAFPDRRVFIAEGGMQVSEVGQAEKLDRIEAKLDALLDALAEEDEEEPQYDLDGNLIEPVEESDSLD